MSPSQYRSVEVARVKQQHMVRGRSCQEAACRCSRPLQAANIEIITIYRVHTLRNRSQQSCPVAVCKTCRQPYLAAAEEEEEVYMLTADACRRRRKALHTDSCMSVKDAQLLAMTKEKFHLSGPLNASAHLAALHQHKLMHSPRSDCNKEMFACTGHTASATTAEATPCSPTDVTNLMCCDVM